MPSPRARTRNWAGILVPAVFVFGLLADGATRFMSLDPFSIRAWEAMTRNAFTEGGIPLEPSKHYENDRAYGDLAALTNRREMREYHREVFTSDAFGYRNAEPFSRERPPEAILVGTSFSMGSGVSDDQTLAVRLGQATGRRIYNAAGGTPSPQQVGRVAQRYGVSHGTVLYEVLESNGFPSRPAPLSRLSRACFDKLGVGCLEIKGWLLVSPIGITSRRAYHWLEDDAWLPNEPASLAVPRLVGEMPMLFSGKEVSDCPGVSLAEARDYFRWFREGLGPLDLFVVLVPSKFTVYGALVDSPRPAAEPAAGESCFVTINRALEDLGIPHVDLTQPLRRAAREGLGRRELLYFRGDTHWNASGIAVAADVIGQAWSPKRTGLATTPE